MKYIRLALKFVEQCDDAEPPRRSIWQIGSAGAYRQAMSQLVLRQVELRAGRRPQRMFMERVVECH